MGKRFANPSKKTYFKNFKFFLGDNLSFKINPGPGSHELTSFNK